MHTLAPVHAVHTPGAWGQFWHLLTVLFQNMVGTLSSQAFGMHTLQSILPDRYWHSSQVQVAVAGHSSHWLPSRLSVVYAMHWRHFLPSGLHLLQGPMSASSVHLPAVAAAAVAGQPATSRPASTETSEMERIVAIET